MSDVTEVPIRDESIRLGQLLKLAGTVENGAIAREVIDAAGVRVDGEVETRRGRQVRRGQLVEFDGEAFGLPPAKLMPVEDRGD
ncbi:RNA-binding S4 domain-containing protein [Nesterenkonia halotolerans]|uniref:RNA-binding S4 domain-containing protein n=1 Tax=Nesterenkonia halotolerans TaxID=225325 RepID=UPI003EE6A68D